MRPCEISLLLPCWSHFLYFLPLLTLHRPLGRSWNILGLFLSVHWFLSFFSRCSERCPTPRKHPTDTHWISKEWINCLVWSTNSSQSIPKCENESCSVLSDSLLSLVLYSPWNSPGQNTGVGSRSLLQEIFPTQGSSPSPTLQADSLPAELPGKPPEHSSLVLNTSLNCPGLGMFRSLSERTGLCPLTLNKKLFQVLSIN